MERKIAFTQAEAEEEMEHYRNVFDVVRILHRDQIGGICSKKDIQHQNCPCYSFWGKSKPCDNCVSARAFLSKKDEVKLELSPEGVYQVVAHYVEIDGVPCVMELLREFDLSNIVDHLDGDQLLSRMNDFYQKTYIDVLTGANNRRFYEEKIKNTSLSTGVAMIDIDDFKVYNDIYGHSAGDSVLSLFVSEIKKNIRSTDKLIRYGGDEFLILMPGISETHLESALRHLLEKIDSISIPGYAEIKLSSSIGATITGKKETIEEAVERADRLLYRAKSKKNAVVTDHDEKVLSEPERITILVVDDAPINRTILTSILGNEYSVIEASGGEEAMNALKRFGDRISLVLLDILMPGVDGFDVLKFMGEEHYLDRIPVITIAGDDSMETLRKAYELGVSDFIRRPFDAKVVYKRVSNAIALYQKQRRLISAVNSEVLEKEKNSHILIDILTQVTEFRSGLGREHITNINRITKLLLVRLLEKTDRYGLNEKDVYLISTASALHDIGKIKVDESILNKPGKLTPEEFEAVKKHTIYGAEILDGLHQYRDEPLVHYAHDICLYHHERYDGKGYPCGLKGDEIPIAAQVVSLADVYDALTSKRVYKQAYSRAKAVDMIRKGECGQFNPLLLECLEELQDILVKNKEGEIE